MSNRLERGVRAILGSGSPPHIRNDTTAAMLGLPTAGMNVASTRETQAMKLSTVDRCIEILSDSIGKLPVYVMDRQTRERVDHPLTTVLSIRPNEAQTPTAAKKMIEGNRNCGGNGYAWILRDPFTLAVRELIPVPHELVIPWRATDGNVWYSVINPLTGEPMTVHRADMIHMLAYTYNGWKGVSVLERASEVMAAGRAAQQYNMTYYLNGGQPAGVLQTDADLAGTVDITLADGTTQKVSKKDIIRTEWEKRHSGPTNAQRVAILDYGLKYTPISISNKDAQFVEQSELSVQDIARFFGVPLYKLQAGKQSYSSNEQNAIEYVVSTLHPIASQYEEELTWKLLPPAEAQRYKIRMNMMAELRGDYASRANWFRTMHDIGGYSVNDIRTLEDMPDVEGGDEYAASLNYIPLSTWRELSVKRNGGSSNES